MLISSMAQNQCDQQYITNFFGRAWKGTPGFSQQGTAGLQCLDLPSLPAVPGNALDRLHHRAGRATTMPRYANGTMSAASYRN